MVRRVPFAWKTEDNDYVVVHAKSRADIGCGPAALQVFVDTPGGEMQTPMCEQLLQVRSTRRLQAVLTLFPWDAVSQKAKLPRKSHPLN